MRVHPQADIPLGPVASRVLLGLLILGAIIYAVACVRDFCAAESAQSYTAQGLMRATRLEGQNAEYWRQLGLLRLYQSPDPKGALDAFHRATELNPRDADSWIGTAYAQQFLGSANAERYALAQAITEEPKRLEIAWQAANLYAVLGDRDAMLRELCIVIAHNPKRSESARDLALRFESPNGAVSRHCDSKEATN